MKTGDKVFVVTEIVKKCPCCFQRDIKYQAAEATILKIYYSFIEDNKIEERDYWLEIQLSQNSYLNRTLSVGLTFNTREEASKLASLKNVTLMRERKRKK